eukprot:3515992-Ditylum_brightwellii.AAC.1
MASKPSPPLSLCATKVSTASSPTNDVACTPSGHEVPSNNKATHCALGCGHNQDQSNDNDDNVDQEQTEDQETTPPSLSLSQSQRGSLSSSTSSSSSRALSSAISSSLTCSMSSLSSADQSNKSTGDNHTSRRRWLLPTINLRTSLRRRQNQHRGRNAQESNTMSPHLTPHPTPDRPGAAE